jgi:hypothetical protein
MMFVHTSNKPYKSEKCNKCLNCVSLAADNTPAKTLSVSNVTSNILDGLKVFLVIHALIRT